MDEALVVVAVIGHHGLLGIAFPAALNGEVFADFTDIGIVAFELPDTEVA